MPKAISEILKSSPVVPVMVIKNIEHAIPLAEALLAGGLNVLEITLRTPVALEALKNIKEAFPDAHVGAGTVITPADVKNAVEAGADFLVSPGATDELIDAAFKTNIPLLPGINTPSEAMRLLAKGISHMKFFPAEAAGGVPMLKSIGGPLGQISFCPTGGIDLEKAKTYLALDNVVCVGGSWMVSDDLMASGRWAEITAKASEAARLAILS